MWKEAASSKAARRLGLVSVKEVCNSWFDLESVMRGASTSSHPARCSLEADVVVETGSGVGGMVSFDFSLEFSSKLLSTPPFWLVTLLFFKLPPIKQNWSSSSCKSKSRKIQCLKMMELKVALNQTVSVVWRIVICPPHYKKKLYFHSKHTNKLLSTVIH